MACKPKILKAATAIGALALIANEVRGFVLSLPVFAALIAEGGTLVAWWTALCALGGIALSVIVPGWLLKKMSHKPTGAR